MAKTSSKSITLTRKQIGQLIELYNHFTEVPRFDILVDHSSGIGTGIQITFDLFDVGCDSTAKKVDITDYASW